MDRHPKLAGWMMERTHKRPVVHSEIGHADAKFDGPVSTVWLEGGCCRSKERR